MKVSIFNDVIGPVMRGPSSSHCAAALRIGRQVVIIDDTEGLDDAVTAVGAVFLRGDARDSTVLRSAGINRAAALITTVAGLLVAIPSMFGYNWLVRRNKTAMDDVRSFGADLHAVLLSAPKPAAKA